MKVVLAVKAVSLCWAMATCLNVAGCGKGEQQPTSEAAAVKAPDQEIWGSEVILSVRGQPRAKVAAAHIMKYEERHLVVMDGGITVDFYGKAGDHVSVLTAKGGEVDETSQDLSAVGNVVVVADDSSRLETERLKWQNSTQKILSDTLVAIVRGEERIVGLGFESDSDLKHWEIKENVTGQLRPVKKTMNDEQRMMNEK